MAGDYSSRRRHVFERHAFQRETTELATQEALKEAISKCFPQAVVRNDLMVGSLRVGFASLDSSKGPSHHPHFSAITPAVGWR